MTSSKKATIRPPTMEAATNFHLTGPSAERIINEVVETIHNEWRNVCTEAELSEVEETLFWERMFLNPSIFER